MNDTNELRQDRINDLIFLLHEREIVTQNGNSIKFSSSIQAKQNEGEILIDDFKKGTYKIHFVDKLTLILSAKDDFKFTNFKETPINTIALIGIDSSAILDCIKILAIK